MLTLSDDQIRYFRARRGHLAGPGAPDPAAAARDLLGAQAQILEPALLAISQRTAARPTAEALKAMMFTAPRRLVRTWGPRETVHLYDPTDWPVVVAARARWSRKGRQGTMPTPAMLDAAIARIQALPAPPDRRDLEPLVEQDYADEIASLAAKARQDPRYFGAGRLVFGLSLRGDICTGEKRGSSQTYPLRTRWFADLPWSTPEADAANLTLVRRYLSLFGPATVQDVAHYLGCTVTSARAWVAALAPECLTVRCGPRTLTALRSDEDALRAPIGDWPIRLLPKFDTLLMGHRDKHWTVPVEAERKRVWKKAAQVEAAVLHRGCVVATWSPKVRKRSVTLTLTPLSGFDKTMLPAIEGEAAAVARHLGVGSASVVVA